MSKKKKLILMVIAVIVLIAAVIAVVRYNEYVASQQPEESSSSIVLKNLFENERENIESINLNNQEGSITIIPNGTDSNGAVQWAIQGHEDWTLTSTHNNLISMACLFQVYKEIETDVTDESRLEEFGLLNPTSTVTITLKDGTQQIVRIGNLSSDQEYTFCMMEGDNTVYACNATYNSYATLTEEGLRQATITSLDTEAQLYSLFAQKKGDRAVMLEYDETQQNVSEENVILSNEYVFVQPYSGEHIQVLSDVASTYYQNLTTPTIVETIEANCSDFDQYGLGDEPEYRETIVSRTTNSDGEYEYTTTDYLFGYTYGENDEYIYFREGDSTLVMGVEVSCLDTRQFEPFSFVNKLVYLGSVNDIQSGSITVGGETHTFSIRRAETTAQTSEATESSSTEEDLATYRVDDTLVNTDAFLSMYQNFLSIPPEYEIWVEDEGVPSYDESDAIEFRIVYNDGTEETIRYYRLSEFYYVTQVQDDLWFACGSSYVENFLEAFNECLNAKVG